MFVQTYKKCLFSQFLKKYYPFQGVFYFGFDSQFIRGKLFKRQQ